MLREAVARGRVGNERITGREREPGGSGVERFAEVQAGEAEERSIVQIMLGDAGDHMRAGEPGAQGACRAEVDDRTRTTLTDDRRDAYRRIHLARARDENRQVEGVEMRRLLIECNDEKGSFRRYRAVNAHEGNATVALVPDALASRIPGAVRVLQAAAVAVITVILAGCSAASPPLDLTPARTDLAPKGDAVAGAIVERVVDGDTIHVRINGDDVTVRMIGIDTPETVKPGSPVACFGPESSDFAKEALTGQSVTLELDASQGDEDRYGRLLAYVWREAPDGSLSLFNLDAVAGGYARERQYGSVPYAWKAELTQAGQAAAVAGAGLWGACS